MLLGVLRSKTYAVQFSWCWAAAVYKSFFDPFSSRCLFLYLVKKRASCCGAGQIWPKRRQFNDASDVRLLLARNKYYAAHFRLVLCIQIATTVWFRLRVSSFCAHAGRSISPVSGEVLPNRTWFLSWYISPVFLGLLVTWPVGIVCGRTNIAP